MGDMFDESENSFLWETIKLLLSLFSLQQTLRRVTLL